MLLRVRLKASSIVIPLVLLTWISLPGCRSIAEREMQLAMSEPSSQVAAYYAHGRYELGSHASAADIRLLDVDIMPDGAGLPVGQGDPGTGRMLFATLCQHCHGPRGSGGAFDQLVGRVDDDGFPFADEPSRKHTIGNYWPYATTLFDYIRRAMPFERPGSLTDDDVYALTAYLLFENAIIGESTSLNQATLPAVRMPARDRFVPDDRRGGREFR